MTRNETINHDTVRAAIDDCFADVQNAPSLLGGVMRRAKGEVKVKKKLSVGLICVIVMLLAAATALAAGLMGWGDGAEYLKKENAQGKFDSWTGAERAALVQSLLEFGAIEESDDTRALLSGNAKEEDQAALAERIMTEWLEAPVDHVAFRPIMEKTWGTFSAWTLEQKAWFTDTMIEAGLQQPDFEKYVLPTSDVLSQEEAKSIAVTYTEIFMGAQTGAFAGNDIVSEYVVMPQRREVDGVVDYTTEGASPVWMVTVPIAQASSCVVEIDPINGDIDLQGLIGKLQYQRFGVDWRVDDGAYAVSEFQTKHHFSSFYEWSLEEKAAWSDTVRALVLAREKEDPKYYDIATRAMTRRCYGLPGESVVKEGDALAAAKQALTDSYGLTAKDLDHYDKVYTYYDVTDEVPVWRFHFSMSGRNAVQAYDDLYDLINYRVEVDANTKEIVTVTRYCLRDATGYEALLNMI